MATTSAVMSVHAIRAAEAATMLTVSEDRLMDRAAAAIADAVAGIAPPSGLPVAVLAGSGNNGGDALLAGALLAQRGAAVTAVALGTTVHARGCGMLERAGGRVVGVGAAADAAVDGAAVVIDGIVGIGSRPGLRDDAEALVARIVSPVVAVDLPSGLDADTGSADAAHVRADVTVTFTAPKRCLVEAPASLSAGRVVLADVGIALG